MEYFKLIKKDETKLEDVLNHFNEEYEIAKEHAGCEPIFIVYGGEPGREIHRRCIKKGWVHVADWTSTIGKPERIHQIST